MKMKFLWVIGVEGTGHHMITSILKNHLKYSDPLFSFYKENFLENFPYTSRWFNSSNLPMRQRVFYNMDLERRKNS